MIFTSVFGIGLGAYASKYRKKPVDYGIRLFSIFIYSIPIFFLGLIFQIIFGVRLNWLPLSGRMDSMILTTFNSITNFYVLDSILTGNWPAFWSAISHLIMPTITLGLALTGTFIRLTRINMIEMLRTDFIAAGRARGIPEKTLVYTHALRNTLIPILTLIGLQMAILIAGAVLTETTFSWPGIGRYLVERISLRDYTAVQSTIAVFAFFVGIISLIMDLMNALVDPRIRY